MVKTSERKQKTNLLRIHSANQPTETAQWSQDAAKDQRVSKNKRIARRLIIVNRSESRESRESSQCDWPSQNVGRSVVLRRSAWLRVLPRPNYVEYNTD